METNKITVTHALNFGLSDFMLEELTNQVDVTTGDAEMTLIDVQRTVEALSTLVSIYCNDLDAEDDVIVMRESIEKLEALHTVVLGEFYVAFKG